MIRICIHHQTSSQPNKSGHLRSLIALFSTTHPSEDNKPVNNLSCLLTSEQKSLLRQSHQLVTQSRFLARQVGNVTVREDGLLSEIVRLRNIKVGEPSSHQIQLDVSSICDDASLNGELPSSLFTVVFAGEFNSGKSTLINALLGKELLESGILPTTDAITMLMGDTDAVESDDKKSTLHYNQLETTPLPAQLHLLSTKNYPLLSDLCLIDTPGTNAIMALQHTTTTLRILHDADLVIFVTSADRPFSESEKDLLKTSMTYRKKVVIVINKMDILERQKGEDHGDASKKRVIEYVEEHATKLLGGRPVIIPVSGRDALSVKMLYVDRRKDEDGIWKRSNFSTLEHYLLNTLTASSKIKTKLLNPIGVAEGMLLECQKEITQRIDDLKVDVMTLRLLNSQTATWERELQSVVMDQCRKDVKSLFIKRSEMVDRVFEQLSFVDQVKMGLGLGRIEFDDAWANSIIQSRSVVLGKQPSTINNQQSGIEHGLLAIFGEYAESITSRSKSQGEISIEYLGKRPSVIGHRNRDDSRHSIVGVDRIRAPKFAGMKEELNQSFEKIVQHSISRLPSDSEIANRVYLLMRKTSIFSLIVSSSAGIGSVAMLANVVDSTAALAISLSLFLIGGFSISLGNRYTSRIISRDWMMHAEKIDASLDILMSEVLRQISTQLAESVAPYSQFVNGEGEHLSELKIKVDSGLLRARAFRDQINKQYDT